MHFTRSVANWTGILGIMLTGEDSRGNFPQIHSFRMPAADYLLTSLWFVSFMRSPSHVQCILVYASLINQLLLRLTSENEEQGLRDMQRSVNKLFISDLSADCLPRPQNTLWSWSPGLCAMHSIKQDLSGLWPPSFLAQSQWPEAFSHWEDIIGYEKYVKFFKKSTCERIWLGSQNALLPGDFGAERLSSCSKYYGFHPPEVETRARLPTSVLWVHPMQLCDVGKLMCLVQCIASRSLTTFSHDPEDVGNILLRVAVSDDSTSGQAALQALLAFSSLHRYGLQSHAAELKISALTTLVAASKNDIGAKEVIQHIATGMLMCSIEVRVYIFKHLHNTDVIR